ncbi:MAG: LamG-like jellyroll fold domain-containing protein, partial [Verrucomicrobiota bacterium]
GGTDRTQLTGSPLVGVIDIADGDIHEVSLCISRISDTELDIRVTVDGASFSTISTPPSADYFTFDELGISEGQNQDWLLDDVSVYAGPDGCLAKVPSFLGEVSVSDNCSDAQNITVSQSPAPGSLIGQGINVITLTATDECGNEGTCTVNIDVVDTTPPAITGVASNVTVECDQIPTAVDPSAADNCDANVSIALAETSISCPNAPLGLIHLYEADGNALDSVGGAHGTIINAGFTNGFVGSGAFCYDGDNDRIELPNTVMDGLADFSVEFWMNSADADEATFISAANAVQFNEFIIIQQPVGTSQVRVFVKGTAWNTGAQILDGAWHHVAFTRSGGLGVLYIDGIPFGSNTVPAAALDVDVTGLMFGQEQDALGGGFTPAQDLDGKMDDVGFYNRALTASEIAGIHAAASEGKCPTSDCQQNTQITR